MRLQISHTTEYAFDGPVSHGLQQLRKTPKSTHNQRVLEWATTVEGGRKELSLEDHHNNVVELISFERGTQRLVVQSRGVVEVAETHGVVGAHIGPAPLWLYRTETRRCKTGAGVRALVRQVDGKDALDRLHGLMRAVHGALVYEIGVSHPAWGAEDALEAGRGVCQDHAHVFITAAREMGFPARYVSGYLMLEDRTAQEAMHAWAEAHVEGLGWIGFDAANCISPDTRYVRVATGLDYADAAPVTGTQVGGHGESLTVQIMVAQQ